MKNICVIVSCLFFINTLYADDTEIYGTVPLSASTDRQTNILLMVDNSGSMRGKIESYDKTLSYTGDFDEDSFYWDEDTDAAEPFGYFNAAITAGRCTQPQLDTLNTQGFLDADFYWTQYPFWRLFCSGGSESRRYYTGNYLNMLNNPTITSRMDVIKQIVNTLASEVEGINIGMMRFDTGDDGDQGGMIEVPIQNISTNKTTITSTVNTYAPYSWTPLSETLFEAQRYFSGGAVKFGNLSTPKSAAGSRTGNNENSNIYNSPIDNECQKNVVIMLTDGDPTEDTQANSDIRTLISNIDINKANTTPGLVTNLSKQCGKDSDDNEIDGGCMAELAYYMNNVDQSTASDDGLQLVTTYTVGAFGGVADTNLLINTAAAGGGDYYSPTTPEALTSAINDIVNIVKAEDSTFTAPAVSVNAFSRASNLDELYFALFKPNDRSNWVGNLKKFKIGVDGKLYSKGSSTQLAIDPTTGYFSENAQDEWSTMTAQQIIDADGIADAKFVERGGAANMLPSPNLRKLYSENSNSVSKRNPKNPYTLIPLEDVANANTLGVNNNEVENLQKWIRGFDVDNTTNAALPRNYMGDPLHSSPLVITYGGTDVTPDATLFLGTNQGFLHAFDTASGIEKFAFMPKALLANQKINYTNNIQAGSRPHGMDGPITSWMNDLNNNSVIYNKDDILESNEHVYIYSGMRRGGRGYYGLDVTDRNNPKLLFIRQGGVTPEFEKLGQTWSQMTVAKVMFNKKPRVVLFFAGGYDTNQDTSTVKENDALGNAIYMIDAKTGKKLWSTSNTGADLNIADMTNSMPASISAVDITGDGFINYLFAADTGGRVFRIDINQENTNARNFADGGMIASLAGTNQQNNRRFFNKPNVAFISDKQFGDYLTISIGSGYRAGPLNKIVQDRFYVIKDTNPFNKPISYISATEADPTQSGPINGSVNRNKLYNATKLMTDGITALTSDMQLLMNKGAGWYIQLPNTGEKVLSESTTFNGIIMFTTFSPSQSVISACSADTGASRFYALNQKTAMPVFDLDGDGTLDGSIQLSQKGIPPKPIITRVVKDPVNDPDDPTSADPITVEGIRIGTEMVDIGNLDCSTHNCHVTPKYWRINEATY